MHKNKLGQVRYNSDCYSSRYLLTLGLAVWFISVSELSSDLPAISAFDQVN